MNNFIRSEKKIMTMEFKKAIDLIKDEEFVYYKTYRMSTRGLKRYAGDPVELMPVERVIVYIKNSKNGVDVHLMEDGHYLVSNVGNMY